MLRSKMFKFLLIIPVLGMLIFKFSQKKPATVLNMDSPVNYTSNSTESDSNENKEAPKVLIFTQTRSGSSFLGSLLTVSKDSFYVFEPFMNWSHNGKPIEEIVNKDNVDNTVIDTVKHMLGKIFTCSHEQVIKFSHQIQVTNSKLSKCEAASVKVIKSVRLRGSVLKSWIEHSDIKVIHLVRDPRAIFNSIIYIVIINYYSYSLPIYICHLLQICAVSE